MTQTWASQPAMTIAGRRPGGSPRNRPPGSRRRSASRACAPERAQTPGWCRRARPGSAPSPPPARRGGAPPRQAGAHSRPPPRRRRWPASGVAADRRGAAPIGRPSASPSFSPRARKDAKHAGAGEKPPRLIAMNAPMKSRYPESYRRSMADPEGFWAEAAGAIDWTTPAGRVFDPDAGIYGRWFVGAECNACYNAVDRHVARRARRAGGDRLRQPGHRHEAHAHLPRAAATRWRRSARCCRSSASARATASSSTCR